MPCIIGGGKICFEGFPLEDGGTDSGFFSALELKQCKGLTSFHAATMFRAQIKSLVQLKLNSQFPMLSLISFSFYACR